MANLPETSTYDSGVYQLETTDPVLGGAGGKANAPGINLANRTKYLKDHVDILETIVPQAEAEAGTATTLRGWTAQRVKQAIVAALTALVVQATETVIGIAEIATQTEADAGTDDARIVTPKKLLNGQAMSLTVPAGNAGGYYKAPTWMGGWILQWGSVNVLNTGTTSTSFTIAFPTVCAGVIHCPTQGATPALVHTGINHVTSDLTGFSARAWDHSGTQIALVMRWHAIGW